jgi:hypothetical protein
MQEEPTSKDKLLFLFMGASNLARGYSLLTRYLSKCLEVKNIEFLNALGPGRGFCAKGGMFNFIYPPIQDCQVIEAVDQKTKNTRVVLITDLGNDLMYGVTADSLIECLDMLIDRMLKWNAEIFLTSIHINIKKDISRTIFYILRFIFYPRSKINFEEADLLITKVNCYLEEKTRKNKKVHLITGMESYVGLDKIHYSLLKMHKAWSKVTDEIFCALNIPATKKLGLTDGITSVLANLKRLIFCDILGWNKKGKDFF